MSGTVQTHCKNTKAFTKNERQSHTVLSAETRSKERSCPKNPMTPRRFEATARGSGSTAEHENWTGPEKWPEPPVFEEQSSGFTDLPMRLAARQTKKCRKEVANPAIRLLQCFHPRTRLKQKLETKRMSPRNRFKKRNVSKQNETYPRTRIKKREGQRHDEKYLRILIKKRR